jgi:predicted flap endonuclease-1-like 5' DNA nuclease
MEIKDFLVLPSIALGIILMLLADMFFYKKKSQGAGADGISSDQQAHLAKLSAQLKVAQSQADRVGEITSTNAKLEARVKELENNNPAAIIIAEADTKIRALEEKKVELETKLAVAAKQLEDLRKAPVVVEPIVAAIAPVETVSPVVSEPVVVAPVVVVPVAAVPVVLETPAVAPVSPVAPEPVSTPTAAQIDTYLSATPNPFPQAPAPAESAPIIVAPEVATPVFVAPAEEVAVAVQPDRPTLRVETTVSDHSRDPLEKIDGIGPVYEQKLIEAGIKTFAQLAAASPSRINEIIEPQSWQHIDVMKWRREAALYAAGEKS